MAGIWLSSRESKAHFGLPWVRPWDNRSKYVTWMERGFNAGRNHLSSTVYELLRDIGRKLQLFPTSLAFSAPVAGVRIGIPGKSLDLRKLESWDYQAVKRV